MNCSPIIAADIGNSRTKVLAGESVQIIEYCNGNTEKNIEKILSEIRSKNREGVKPILAFSSVNPPVLDIFSAIALLLEFDIFDAAAAVYEFSPISFDNISGMGSDRIFGLIGARERAFPPFITVDSGTAVTINAVDRTGNCIGGVIFPGFRAQLASLTEKTANLRPVSLFWEEFSAGTNTEQAIRRGIVHSIAAGASNIIGRMAEEIGDTSNIPVFLTGGGAELMHEEILRRFSVIECPNLVCEGIIATAKRYFTTA